jgi:RNA polymerase primary sigma factor
VIGSEESLSFSDDLLESMDKAKNARYLLSLLDPREEQILRLRFGIGEPRSYTLEEVGKRFGISRERVRQIEQRALSKLQAKPRARAIYGNPGGVEMMPVR